MRKVKRIPLELYCLGFVCNDDHFPFHRRYWLCAEGVREYFDIGENKHIVLCLTSYKVQDSYLVQVPRAFCGSIRIELSTGEEEFSAVHWMLRDAIEEMGGSCYLSIEI